MNNLCPGPEWKPGYIPAEPRVEPGQRTIIIESAIRASSEHTGRSNVEEITFSKATCLQCNTLHKNRKTDQITDYMTKGDDAFSQLMKQLIAHQADDPKKSELPNKGKKVMVFSDSRSRAAKLARENPRQFKLDELRLLVLHLLNQIGTRASILRSGLCSTFIHRSYSIALVLKSSLFPGLVINTGIPDITLLDKNRCVGRSRFTTKTLENKDAFLERNLELKTIIDSSNKEISDNQRAIGFYTDFVKGLRGIVIGLTQQSRAWL